MINNDTVIYVLVPRNVVTGGTESLHQLAYELKKLHSKVFIHYINSQELTIPIKFEKYKIPISKEIVDSEENLLIVPETNTEYLNKVKVIQKCIWWLSLDYYIRQLPRNATYYFCKKHKLPLYLTPLVTQLLRIAGKLKTNIYSFNDYNRPVFHLYNCEYVRGFLEGQGVSDENMMYLCGPIGDEYFERKIEKNIISLHITLLKGLRLLNKL